MASTRRKNANDYDPETYVKKSGCVVIRSYNDETYKDSKGFQIKGWCVYAGSKWDILCYQTKAQFEKGIIQRQGRDSINVTFNCTSPFKNDVVTGGYMFLEDYRAMMLSWNYIMSPDGGKGGAVVSRYYKKD